MNRPLRLTLALTTVLLCTLSERTQVGGGYTLDQSVVAGGGGQASTGGQFSVDGSAGQAGAGTISTGSFYRSEGGFWTVSPGTPTAAAVSVSGRVTTPDGRGIRNVQVVLSGFNGQSRAITTGSFGYYRFDGVEAGAVYILSVYARRYTFTPNTRVCSVQDEAGSVDFVADGPRWSEQ